VGPGAATNADLTPWAADAKDSTITGTLWEFNVAGATGSYDTWGLAATAGTTGTRTLGLDSAEGVEVDVRHCADAAERFRDRDVIVTGRLIERGSDHLPLLVAECIRPAGDADRLVMQD
jgi:hypothetical protein